MLHHGCQIWKPRCRGGTTPQRALEPQPRLSPARHLRAEATKSQGLLSERPTQTSIIAMAGCCGGLRDVLGPNLAQSPASVFQECGCCSTGHRHSPAPWATALSRWQSSSWSPLQSKGKLEPEKYLPQSLMILQHVRGRRAGSKASSLPSRSLTESLESWPRGAPALVECDTHLRRGTQLWLEKRRGRSPRAREEQEPAAFHPHPTIRRLPLTILLPPDQGEAFPPPAIEARSPGIAWVVRGTVRLRRASDGAAPGVTLWGTTLRGRLSSSETASWRQIFMYVYTYSSTASRTQRKVSLGSRLMWEMP